MACLSWDCLFLFEELAEGAPETPLGLVPWVVVAEGCLLIVILLAEPGVVFCMELLKGKRQFNQHLQPHILVTFFLCLCARRDLVGEEVLARETTGHLGLGSTGTSAESLLLALRLRQWQRGGRISIVKRELEPSLLSFFFRGSLLAPFANEGASQHGELKELPTLSWLMSSVYPRAGRLQVS